MRLRGAFDALSMQAKRMEEVDKEETEDLYEGLYVVVSVSV